MNDIFASDQSAVERNVTVTDNAARRIAYLVAQEGGEGLFLRISVSGGGCSGFQYAFGFDDEIKADDRVFDHAGIKVVVDETSLDLMGGAEIDFVEDLIGASFQVRNPNATASCGCGSSFSV